MWEADIVMQVQMPKFAKIRSDFICIYKKSLAVGSPLLFVFICKHRWRTTGSWKNACGVLESPGNLCNQESGNPG